MISEMEARRRGANRCVELIGREFCIANKDRAVSSFGRIGNKVDVFVGVTDETTEKEKHILSEKPFKYNAIVYVDMKSGLISDGDFVSAN